MGEEKKSAEERRERDLTDAEFKKQWLNRLLRHLTGFRRDKR